MNALKAISTKITAQSQRADARQVPNHAGGYTYAVTPQVRLRRFLTLGVEGGTYYARTIEHTRENADVVLDFAQNDTVALVREIVEISTAGRAPKQNPALFALAAAASLGDDTGRKIALEALPQVARTGTHLFLFATYVEQFRGWGRGLRRAVANWYLAKPVDDIAYQAVKYRQRDGWTHRDLLRLAHPMTDDPARAGLFDYICHGTTGTVPRIVEGYLRAQDADANVPALIEDYGLSWEMLPDAALTQADTWEALLDRGMPLGALLRQLPRLTGLGVLGPLSDRTGAVVARLTDAAALRQARIHPVNVLVALRTYARGVGARGVQWTPSQPIVDALDAAFYAAFGAVQPSHARHLLALDVSGSMGYWPISGLPLTPREAAAALALVTAATEPHHQIVGFAGGLTELSISPRQRLDDAIAAVSDLPFDMTDCALPMQWALRHKIEVDVFSVYTDNETWAGQMHPHQALAEYRRQVNPAARLVVVGMTATDFSIADPDDAGMLDVAGFDAATPSLLSGFARGEL